MAIPKSISFNSLPNLTLVQCLIHANNFSRISSCYISLLCQFRFYYLWLCIIFLGLFILSFDFMFLHMYFEQNTLVSNVSYHTVNDIRSSCWLTNRNDCGLTCCREKTSLYAICTLSFVNFENCMTVFSKGYQYYVKADQKNLRIVMNVEIRPIADGQQTANQLFLTKIRYNDCTDIFSNVKNCRILYK